MCRPQRAIDPYITNVFSRTMERACPDFLHKLEDCLPVRSIPVYWKLKHLELGGIEAIGIDELTKKKTGFLLLKRPENLTDGQGIKPVELLR